MISRKKLKARYYKKARSVFREHRFLLSTKPDSFIACYKTGMNAHCGQKKKKQEAVKLAKIFSGNSREWKNYAKLVPLVFKARDD